MSQRNAVWVVWLALLVWSGGHAGPSAGAAEASFRFRVDRPTLESVDQADGTVELRMAGFRTSEGAPGAPDIPVQTVLVAIPPDAEPRLEVQVIGRTTRRARLPRPVPQMQMQADGSSPPGPAAAGDARLWAQAKRPVLPRYQRDPRIFERAALYPARAAWLGEIGVVRDQRYVEVHLAPVRYDGAARGLLLEESLEVTVHFDGASAATSEPASTRFEPVYRRSFINYEQGRAFRLPLAKTDLQVVAEATAGTEPDRRRIVVRQNGPLRLTYELFLAQAPEFLDDNPAKWKLTSDGEQVKLHIQQGGGNPNLLEPGEWVQFYGQAKDDEPASVLIADNGGNEDLYAVRDFTDDNVYFLSVEAATQPAMPTREAAPGIGTPPTFFNTTTHVEADAEFSPFGGEDPWFSEPVLTEIDNLRTESVPLPGLQSTTAPLQVRVGLRGSSGCRSVNPDHKSTVGLRNASSQTLTLPVSNPDNVSNQNLGQFDAQEHFLHDFGWTHSGIQPQASDPLQVLVGVSNISGCPNNILLDWIEIDYRRSFASAGDRLTFSYPDGTAIFAVTGLSSTNVQVYEITGTLGASGIVDAVRLTSVQFTPTGPTFTARFRMDNGGSGMPRRFAVVGPLGVAAPAAADFKVDRVSELASDTTPAELIVVAHPDLLESSCSVGANSCDYDADCTASPSDRCELDPSSELSQLLAHRATQGISSRVARIGDVEDEFNQGLAGPLAIRKLVEWTMAGNWSGSPPSYLLLLGDASFDHKAGPANGNYVSTQIVLKENESLGFYASDNLLAAVSGGDSLPELVVGRISARTLAEADTVLQKIRLYEQTPAAGGWRGHAVFISDRANDFSNFEPMEFERINRIGENKLLASASYTKENLRYWSDNCVPPNGAGNPTCDKVAMRLAIQNAVNGVSGPGAALMQFMGHGNFELWSSDVLFCANPANPSCVATGDDILTLNNGLKLPWLLVHNCLSGGFHSTDVRALGEDWLKRGPGGAVAVFAPSGLGFRYLGEIVVNEAWEDLFGPTKERSLAVPVLDSLVSLCATSGTPEGCQFYTLLGDPSTTLALPHVDPPTAVVAQAGNALVQLSWSASPTAASYDVYRSSTPASSYIKINSSPITVTHFNDTAGCACSGPPWAPPSNGITYYYYVVARSAAGFESARSNFNSDCFTTQDDCVFAEPLNPFPPAPPTGLAVVDPETGARLDLSWNANAENDVSFYTVHFGTTPALGQTANTVLNSFALTGLADETPYYIRVSATNTSGLTSALSGQVSATPSLVLGLKAPRFIGDLRLNKSGAAGANALLTWGAVTTDVYGKPFSTDHYEVYRGTSPQFTPTLASRIGTSPTPSYTDVGALSAPAPRYYYLVRAMDADGTGGGLGNQLPDGIRELRVAQVVGHTVLISWPAVTTDFDDHPLAISHYALYASDVPFSRADIRDGMPPLLSSITGVSVMLSGQTQNRYYSVLAVDARGNLSPF